MVNDGDGRHAEKRRGAPARQHYANDAAHRREQRGFGEDLPNEMPSAGAERHAHCHFLFAPGGARQHQIRDVRAGDQQDDSDRAEQDVEKPFDASHRFVA